MVITPKNSQIVATLIANPALEVLSSDFVGTISSVLAKAGATDVNIEELSPGKAYDILLRDISIENAENIVREKFGEKPFDVIVQQALTRRKKMLVSDMDATFVIGETTKMIAAQAGPEIEQEIGRLTELVMSNPTIDYSTSLKTRFAPLAGITEAQLQHIFDEVLEISPGGIELVQTMKANDGFTVLLSGGTTWLASKIAETAGFDVIAANNMLMENGALTGEVAEPVLDRAGKAEKLRELSLQRRIRPSEIIVVGDGANDLDMLTYKGGQGGSALGIAYHAKEAVREAAPSQINHVGLEALLYCQGYKEHEIITDKGTERGPVPRF